MTTFFTTKLNAVDEGVIIWESNPDRRFFQKDSIPLALSRKRSHPLFILYDYCYCCKKLQI